MILDVDVDVDVDVVVDLDGDGGVDVGVARPHTILVNIATTPSSSWMPRSYRSAAMSLRSFRTSRDAAHSIASPRAIL